MKTITRSSQCLSRMRPNVSTFWSAFIMIAGALFRQQRLAGRRVVAGPLDEFLIVVAGPELDAEVCGTSVNVP